MDPNKTLSMSFSCTDEENNIQITCKWSRPLFFGCLSEKHWLWANTEFQAVMILLCGQHSCAEQKHDCLNLLRMVSAFLKPQPSEGMPLFEGKKNWPWTNEQWWDIRVQSRIQDDTFMGQTQTENTSRKWSRVRWQLNYEVDVSLCTHWVVSLEEFLKVPLSYQPPLPHLEI